MKIAFVGKGGSGKTTLSCLFSKFVSEKSYKTLLIDADVNMHCARLLGLEGQMHTDLLLSNPKNVSSLKTYMKGDNKRIQSLKAFRKTTPPGTGSGILDFSDEFPEALKPLIVGSKDLGLAVVGTYDEKNIGTTCYHVNLSILENVLSHTVERENSFLLVDMVAGTDCFANTLHAQFDLFVLVVEPTARGVDVFKQFVSLAKVSGIDDRVLVVGNKIRDSFSKDFLQKEIPVKYFFDCLPESEYLRKIEITGEGLETYKLEPEVTSVLEKLFEKSKDFELDSSKRLEYLKKMHLNYASSEAVINEFGDLRGQIDESFKYER